MLPGKKPRDPLQEYMLMQYVRTFLLFLGLIVIAMVIAHVGGQ
jgi:hypothetical protein